MSIVEETGSKMRGEIPNDSQRTIRFRKSSEIAGAEILLAGEAWLIQIPEEIFFKVGDGGKVDISTAVGDSDEDLYLEQLHLLAVDDSATNLRADAELLRVGVEFLIRCLGMNYELSFDEIEKIINRSILETKTAIGQCLFIRLLPPAQFQFVVSMTKIANRWIRDNPEMAQKVVDEVGADKLESDPNRRKNDVNDPGCSRGDL